MCVLKYSFELFFFFNWFLLYFVEKYFVDPQLQVAYVGSVVKFKCTIPKAKWIRAEPEIPMPLASSVSNQGVLTIVNVSFADYGNYSCYDEEYKINPLNAELIVGGNTFIFFFFWYEIKL